MNCQFLFRHKDLGKKLLLLPSLTFSWQDSGEARTCWSPTTESMFPSHSSLYYCAFMLIDVYDEPFFEGINGGFVNAAKKSKYGCRDEC
jgi:hypothetical protein